MRASAIAMLAVSLSMGGSTRAASPTTEAAFAEILSLEDHRTLGGTTLVSYLAPDQTKEVRSSGSLSVIAAMR